MAETEDKKIFFVNLFAEICKNEFFFLILFSLSIGWK